MPRSTGWRQPHTAAAPEANRVPEAQVEAGAKALTELGWQDMGRATKVARLVLEAAARVDAPPPPHVIDLDAPDGPDSGD